MRKIQLRVTGHTNGFKASLEDLILSQQSFKFLSSWNVQEDTRGASVIICPMGGREAEGGRGIVAGHDIRATMHDSFFAAKISLKNYETYEWPLREHRFVMPLASFSLSRLFLPTEVRSFYSCLTSFLFHWTPELLKEKFHRAVFSYSLRAFYFSYFGRCHDMSDMSNWKCTNLLLIK